MHEPAAVVQSFFEAMQRRDWPSAYALVAPDAEIRFTETGERFAGTKFVAMNEAYPEGWTIDVVETFESGDRAACQVRVGLPPDTFWCSGFYTVGDGTIVEGVEHWVTANSEPAPEWRRPFTL